MRRLPLLVWLMVLWMVLWGDVSPPNVIGGIAVGFVVTSIFPVRSAPTTHRVRPVRLVVFIGHFTWKIVQANLEMAPEILDPRDTTRTGIVAVPLTGASDLVTTIVANTVSLTPGTLTVEVSSAPRCLYVHVLRLHDVEKTRRELEQFARLARAAFGSNPDAGVEPSDEWSG